MIEIALRNIKKAYGINQILEDITFDVKTNEVAGIVGENGAGKTTIFKIIKKIEQPDYGVVDLVFKNSISYLEQIPTYEKNVKVEEVIKSAFNNINELEEKIKEKEKEMQNNVDVSKVLKQYDTLVTAYETLDGYNKEINYKKICTGLGFTDDFLSKEFNLLSGGEKTKVLLGKTLLENSKVLLLDEPTNHLDIDMVEWLEEYIKQYKGTILIISHDRFFLDRVATKIIEIEDGKSKTYEGNYTAYKNQKEIEIEKQYEMYKTQQKKIKAMKAAILRLKDFGSACHSDKNPFYKRAFNMERRLEKMDKVEKVKEKSEMKINVCYENRSANNVIIVENASKSFDEKQILDKANLIINYRERVALIGKNGAGKTTFIKILLGQENIDSGKITLGANTDVAYLEQNVKFENEELTILEYFRENIEITENEARKYLAKFLFFADEVFKKISKLSGGEKSRLRLAKMIYFPNNLLILDEPTNHLDIDAREQIEDVLLEYKGTVLIISHDRYFINKIATKIVELENKKLVSYDGKYDYYLEKTKDKVKEEKEEIKVKKINSSYEEHKKQKSRGTEIRRLETAISKLEEKIKTIDLEMEDNKSDYVKLNELFILKEKIKTELEENEEKWLNMQ